MYPVGSLARLGTVHTEAEMHGGACSGCGSRHNRRGPGSILRWKSERELMCQEASRYREPLPDFRASSKTELRTQQDQLRFQCAGGLQGCLMIDRPPQVRPKRAKQASSLNQGWNVDMNACFWVADSKKQLAWSTSTSPREFGVRCNLRHGMKAGPDTGPVKQPSTPFKW